MWGSRRPTSPRAYLEHRALFLKAMQLCNPQSLHSTHVSMSDSSAAAQDQQPLLGLLPATTPTTQTRPPPRLQRPRDRQSAAQLWIISALVLVGVILSFLTQIGYMGAGSSKGGHHSDVFKQHGQNQGSSQGQSQSQNQDPAVGMSGKRSVGYFVSSNGGPSKDPVLHVRG